MFDVQLVRYLDKQLTRHGARYLVSFTRSCCFGKPSDDIVDVHRLLEAHAVSAVRCCTTVAARRLVALRYAEVVVRVVAIERPAQQALVFAEVHDVLLTSLRDRIRCGTSGLGRGEPPRLGRDRL